MLTRGYVVLTEPVGAAVMIYNRIREVLGSNLTRGSTILIDNVPSFPQSLEAKTGIIPSPPKFFAVHHLSIVFHYTRDIDEALTALSPSLMPPPPERR